MGNHLLGYNKNISSKLFYYSSQETRLKTLTACQLGINKNSKFMKKSYKQYEHDIICYEKFVYLWEKTNSESIISRFFFVGVISFVTNRETYSNIIYELYYCHMESLIRDWYVLWMQKRLGTTHQVMTIKLISNFDEELPNEFFG